MSNFRIDRLGEANLGNVFCCIRHNREQYQADIADALEYMKEKVFQNWRAYAAFDETDKAVAMAIAVPGSDSLSPIQNKDFYYLHCMDVNKEFRNKGIGTKLIKRIMKDIKAAKSKGLVVDCYGDYWMPDGFFAKQGFECIKSFPDHRVMAKKLSKGAAVEFTEAAYKGDLPKNGIQVDIQYWITCPVMLNNYRQIPAMAKAIDPQAIIRERMINTREDVDQWGGSGVYVNGKSVSPGPVREGDLRRAFESAKNKAC